jgi:hypothetical protein
VIPAAPEHGTVTVRLHGYGVPITTTGEHLALVVKALTQ